MPPAATLARLMLLEARRGGLPWLAAGCIALGIGLGAFLSQVALTESRELQLALVAAWLRTCAVFLIAAGSPDSPPAAPCSRRSSRSRCFSGRRRGQWPRGPCRSRSS